MQNTRKPLVALSTSRVQGLYQYRTVLHTRT